MALKGENTSGQRGVITLKMLQLSLSSSLHSRVRFSASVHYVSSSLFSSHNGGSLEEIAQEAGRSRRDHTQRVEQARPADPTKMATSQAAAGTVDSK